MRVTVFGATGQLGRVTVPALVAAGHEVTAVVRREEALAEVAEQGARAVLADLEGGPNADLGPALADAEAVVWVAGANVMTGPEHSDRVDRDGALRAIAAAADAGVVRWVQVSSFYANRWESGPEVLHRFLQNKHAADEALKASGIGWTILRPGGLSNDAPRAPPASRRSSRPARAASPGPTSPPSSSSCCARDAASAASSTSATTPRPPSRRPSRRSETAPGHGVRRRRGGGSGRAAWGLGHCVPWRSWSSRSWSSSSPSSWGRRSSGSTHVLAARARATGCGQRAVSGTATDTGTVAAPARPAPGAEPDEVEPDDVDRAEVEQAADELAAAPPTDVPEPAAGRLVRLRSRLARSQSALGKGLLAVLSRDTLDDAAWDDIEATLLRADVGVGATTELIEHLRTRLRVEGARTPSRPASCCARSCSRCSTPTPTAASRPSRATVPTDRP